MIFRAYVKGDDTAVANLEKLCFSLDAWTEEMVKETSSLKTFNGIVCESDGEVIGYVMTAYVLDEADVLTIAVHPNYRRKGVADGLLTQIFTILKEKGVSKIFLEVRRGNQSAIKLYQKNGFEIISQRKNYYGDEDALIFLKTLN